MPCRYVIDKERRLVISTGWDRLTYSEMNEHQQQLLSDPDFDPAYDQLMDARSVTVVEASVDEVKMLVWRKFFSLRSKRAWVANKPQVYAMFRMGMAHNEMSEARSNMCPFYNLSEAVEWLGLKSLPDGIRLDNETSE